MAGEAEEKSFEKQEKKVFDSDNITHSYITHHTHNGCVHKTGQNTRHIHTKHFLSIHFQAFGNLLRACA